MTDRQLNRRGGGQIGNRARHPSLFDLGAMTSPNSKMMIASK